jgi:ATP-binding cassette subfamily B protein
VFQDFRIFAGTVAENVVMDTLKGGEEEKIREALSDSGLLKRVGSMENGIESYLTTETRDDGINLSGGESQKLAISRVFYQNAGLMILDEPSSALDPIAEYQLNHAMLTATRDKTVIFISHRLSTTRIADRIIMLENGQVVEEGTHDELLARGGKYAGMWRVQAGAYM